MRLCGGRGSGVKTRGLRLLLVGVSLLVAYSSPADESDARRAAATLAMASPIARGPETSDELIREGLTFVAAGNLGREHGGEQILGPHPLDRHRNSPSSGVAEQGERARDIPTPPVGEHRRNECRLHQVALESARPDQGEHTLERKAVLFSQGENDTVIRGRCLKLEIERHAEPLA